MKKALFQFIFTSLICVLIWSCDKNRVIEQYQSIPKTGWNKDSLSVFNFEITDTLDQYNIFINVRNNIKYSYSNLWLFIALSQPSGITSKDTFEISLADPSGKWLGEGFGGIKTRQAVYRQNVPFNISGKYTIVLQHGMRNTKLKGITDIGCRIEKVDKSE